LVGEFAESDRVLVDFVGHVSGSRCKLLEAVGDFAMWWSGPTIAIRARIASTDAVRTEIVVRLVIAGESLARWALSTRLA
jgi:hypothetical protein